MERKMRSVLVASMAAAALAVAAAALSAASCAELSQAPSEATSAIPSASFRVLLIMWSASRGVWTTAGRTGPSPRSRVREPEFAMRETGRF